MKKKIADVSVLFIVAMVSAFLLSFVYKQTSPVIEQYSKEKIESSLREVFPDTTVEFETVKKDTLWRVFKDGKCVGIIFRYGKQGYSSTIRPIVGVDSTGKIIDIKISREGLSETPGLGMKVTEDWFQEQFSGLNRDEVWLKKDNENGKLDAVTAATISSRAATAAVREGLEKYSQYLSDSAGVDCKWFEDDIEKLLGSSDYQVIKKDTLWKSDSRYLTLTYRQGFASPVGVLTVFRNDTILKIHIQKPEEGLEETPDYGGMVAGEEFEGRFEGIPAGEVNEVDAYTGATMTSNAVKGAVEDAYRELIRGGNK